MYISHWRMHTGWSNANLVVHGIHHQTLRTADGERAGEPQETGNDCVSCRPTAHNLLQDWAVCQAACPWEANAKSDNRGYCIHLIHCHKAESCVEGCQPPAVGTQGRSSCIFIPSKAKVLETNYRTFQSSRLRRKRTPDGDGVGEGVPVMWQTQHIPPTLPCPPN